MNNGDGNHETNLVERGISELRSYLAARGTKLDTEQVKFVERWDRNSANTPGFYGTEATICVSESQGRYNILAYTLSRATPVYGAIENLRSLSTRSLPSKHRSRSTHMLCQDLDERKFKKFLEGIEALARPGVSQAL